MTNNTRKTFLRPIRVLRNLVYLSLVIRLRSILKYYAVINLEPEFSKI